MIPPTYRFLGFYRIDRIVLEHGICSTTTMQILFSDLGRPLIDPVTHSSEAATPVLERIRNKRIPFVLVTDKTRAEVEFWRDTTGIRFPFIVEGGGAIFFPSHFFPHGHLPLPFRTIRRSGYDVLEFGVTCDQLIIDLKRAAEMAGCIVRGFHEMTFAELAQDAGMSELQAQLAKQREYSEPFRIIHGDIAILETAIQALGRRVTRRDSYLVITGNNHVSGAVRILSQAFTMSYGHVTKIGLGTGPDDLPFLKVMDRVVFAEAADWNRAALSILEE
jgi:mannosyl-3-phosphoglycerate phosphatase